MIFNIIGYKLEIFFFSIIHFYTLVLSFLVIQKVSLNMGVMESKFHMFAQYFV